jgi:transketolase
MTEGNDVTLVATGHLVWEALEASKVLFEQGISAEVINIHTIKPLDEEIILKSVSKTGCIVSAEEHNYLGGLGESISRLLSQNNPTPQEFIATQDTFGESGTPAQLMEKYGLNSENIIKKVKSVIQRK